MVQTGAHQDVQAQADFEAALNGVPLEELRLALVLNGGVSLAVWMGGVAHEIDRLTRAEPGNGAGGGYDAMLQAARTTVTVDVISGTSAGGINGAALALAQANKRADLRVLRTLWAEQGRMEKLLRRPFQGAPTSMLRGDDYFLPELQRAMQMLSRPFVSSDKRPQIDLTLTTTLLNGAQQTTVDDFGEEIPQRIHAGSFNFSNVGKGGQPLPEEQDIFGGDNIWRTSQALALAARCSASFPFAFEPSFVPVGEDSSDGRPDMEEFASWCVEGGGVQSRYTVDGGLLANTPLTHALKAIAKRQADGPVRRAMLMVYPHAPRAEKIPADMASAPPSAAGAVGDVLGALLAQGSRSLVDGVDEHNKAAAEWVGSREQILKGLGSEEPVRAVFRVVEVSWRHYRHIRIRDAARGLVHRVKPREQWSYERIREAAEAAQHNWRIERGRPLPYVPTSFLDVEAPPPDPTADPATDPAVEWREKYLDDALGWHWGDSAATGVVDSVAAVLRSALSVAGAAQVGPLSTARKEVGKCYAAIEERRADLDEVWLTNPFLRSREPGQRYWTARILAYEFAMHTSPQDSDTLATAKFDELLLAADRKLAEQEAGPRKEAVDLLVSRDGTHGEAVWKAVRTSIGQLRNMRVQLESIAATDAGELAGVTRWMDFLCAPMLPHEPQDEDDRMVLRLLALDAGTRLLADGTPVGANLPVRLGELSLRVEHPWARFSVTPEDKAAGLQLARFGGFLKRSWRMNDWTWGRLDAVTMLCQTVLDPRRLRRMAAVLRTSDAHDVSPQLFTLLKSSLYGDGTLPNDYVQMEERAHAELKAALAPGAELRHLPALAAWAALPLQAEIILEELPVLAAAVQVDRDEGAGSPTRGTRFLLDHASLLRRIENPTDGRADALARGLEALRAFDSAGIGREDLSEETGSNALIRTASRAASVLATVLDADAGRSARAVKPVTSALRGAVMLPHWIVTGLASSGSIAKFLSTAGLVIGGLLLTLSLVGALGAFGPAGGLVGGATLLAGLGYSALRTGSLVHAYALLAPVVPLLAFAFDAEGPMKDKSSGEAASRVVLVVLAVTALYVLANIPWPLYSPLENLHRAVRALGRGLVRLWVETRRWWTVLVAALLVAAGVGWAWRTWGPSEETRDRWVDWLVGSVGVACLFVAVIVIGLLLAYRQGIALRAWRSNPQVEVDFETPERVGGLFERKPVAHPAGVAASWAPVYGGVYLAVAWLLHLNGWAEAQRWQQISFWWLTAVGLLLCLLAPFIAGRGARRAIRRAVSVPWADRRRDREFLPAGADDARQLIHLLLKYDRPYAFLVRAQQPKRFHRAGVTGESEALELTGAGRRLLEDLLTAERASS